MADFAGAVGVSTLRNDDFKVKIVDAASGDVATNVLAINADGSVNTVTKITDGTDDLGVNADGSINAVVTATDLDIRNLTAASDSVSISDGTNALDVNADGSINVVATATDLDIRALSHTTDSVKVGDGTTFIDVNSDGSINVVSSKGAPKLDYGTSAAVAKDATANFDYVITSGKTFTGESILIGAEGKTKATFGSWDGSTFTPMGVFFQQPSLNEDKNIQAVQLVGDGTLAFRVTVTNKDQHASDLYCTIQGFEK
jgi:hypothetical protein